MDWTVTFRPEDTTDMSKTRIAKRVSPKVVLTIRLGKGMVGAGIPVLVEDMSFKGEMRVKLKFMSNFPHVKIVDACFMQKPQFDYVLKPIGGETFGFDVTNVSTLISELLETGIYLHIALFNLDTRPSKLCSRPSTCYLGSHDVLSQCIFLWCRKVLFWWIGYQ